MKWVWRRPFRPARLTIRVAAVGALVAGFLLPGSTSGAAGAAKKRPDLVITKLSLSLQTVQPGGFVLARDTVKNRGSAKAGRSVMRHYLSTDKRKGASDTRLRGKRRVKALRPKKKNKGAAVVSVPATSARGHYFLIACADDTRKVRERKEKNNCKSTGLSVTNPPDTNPPTTTITGGPANGSRANTRTATFSFSSSEPGSTFTCNLDYSNQGPCTSPKSYSGLADGYHSFRVQATDPSGNQDPVGAYRSWQIDATAPDTKIASNRRGHGQDDGPVPVHRDGARHDERKVRVQARQRLLLGLHEPEELLRPRRCRPHLPGAGEGCRRERRSDARPVRLDDRPGPGHNDHGQAGRSDPEHECGVPLQLEPRRLDLRVQARQRRLQRLFEPEGLQRPERGRACLQRPRRL